jgi:hypothetical protein
VTKSVKRTAEKSRDRAVTISAVRFTDSNPLALDPSDKSLGYFQSSAVRTLGVNTLFRIFKMAFQLKSAPAMNLGGRLALVACSNA